MRSVALKVLKNKLIEYVRLAERGETILVTDRDRVVAEIMPPALALKGVPPRSPVMSFRQLMAELDDDRGER